MITMEEEKKDRMLDHSRSDAMILTTFNQSKHQIRMLSIPRDTIATFLKLAITIRLPMRAHAYRNPCRNGFGRSYHECTP